MVISLVGVNTRDNLGNNAKPFNALPVAGTVAGDMMITTFVTTANVAGDLTPTVPSGWTPLFSALDADLASQPLGMFVYYRWATASEPASWSWTDPATVLRMIASVAVYRGVDPTTPFVTGEYGGKNLAGTGSDGPRTTPTYTIGGSDRWLIALYAGRQAESYVGSMTERLDYATSNTTLMLEDSNGVVAAGSYSKTATASAGAGIAVSALIAMKSAPSTVPPSITGVSTDGGFETVIVSANSGSSPITSYSIVSGDPGGSLQPGGPSSNVLLVPRNATADFNITVKATSTVGDSPTFSVLIPKTATSNPNENIRMRKYNGTVLQ